MSRYKTPLRYPGGKQKLAPFISEIMDQNALSGAHYVEPYAGGAGVAMELLLTGKATHVHLNDACKGIYAFWRSILTRTEEFCRRISSASLNIDEWRRQKDIHSRPTKHRQLDVGFSFFYLNRCNRSGIPSGGVIGGLQQNGRWRMDARFPRNELIRRIEAIADKRTAITVKNWDAERFLLEYVPTLPQELLVYCDPPYFNKAQRLYLNHYAPEDHRRLAKVMQERVKRPWLVSYDTVPPIMEHYAKRRSFCYDVQYNAANAYKGSEVFFLSDDLKLPSSSNVAFIEAALQRL